MKHLILKELKKTNSSMDNMSKRMDSIDNRLKSVERQQKETSISPSSSVETTKRKIPSRVRVCYNHAVDHMLTYHFEYFDT